MALRTLRQVPRYVDETRAGEPIFEIRSVRLVLPADASHFEMLTTCSKCGRDVPGPPVLSPGDLDLRPQAVICKDCVRTAAPMYGTPMNRSVVADAPVMDVAAGNGAGIGRGQPRVADDDRLEALERRTDELVEMLQAQAAEREAATDGRAGEPPVELIASTADARLVTKAQARRIDKTSERLAGGIKDLEQEVRKAVGRLTEMLESQRAELRALEERTARRDERETELEQLPLDIALGGLRSEIAALRDADQALAEGQVEVEDRLRALADAPPAGRASAGQGRAGPRAGRRAAMVAVSATTEDLAGENQQLKVQLDTLRHAVDAAARDAAVASSQASAMEPLRGEVRALQEQVAAQDSALAALTRSVERLRRKIPSQAPNTAKKAPRATKG